MRWICPVFSALVLLPASASAAIHWIAPDGSGDYPTIQAALDAAQDGDVVQLAAGLFTGAGNRDLDYLGKAVTVRSALGDPATCVLDCDGSESEPHWGVVFGSAEGAASVLIGVTITHGWAGTDPYGAAVLCVAGSSPTIEHCIFADNVGSALAIDDGSDPTVVACAFRRNHSPQGGAVRIRSSHGAFTGCSFEDNDADWGGGAVHAGGSSGTFSGCAFHRNSSDSGGAVRLMFSGDFTFTDCVFLDNQAVGSGAMLVFFSTAWLTNCTFAGNEAQHFGSAIGSGKMAYVHLSSSTFFGNVAGQTVLALGERQSWLDHCVVAFNRGAPACLFEGDVTLTCCDLYGNEGGDWIGSIAEQLGQAGNISLDPLFCAAEEGDFTLAAESPCAPGECDLIGAWPVACEIIVVESTTWGALKASFR